MRGKAIVADLTPGRPPSVALPVCAAGPAVMVMMPWGERSATARQNAGFGVEVVLW
jgi:hypothetical protein